LTRGDVAGFFFKWLAKEEMRVFIRASS